MAENAPDPHPDTVGYYIQVGQDSYLSPYADNSYKVAGGGIIATPTELAALPRPGGFLMVSGVLQEDLGELAGEFATAGLSEIDRDYREPWAVLVLERQR